MAIPTADNLRYKMYMADMTYSVRGEAQLYRILLTDGDGQQEVVGHTHVTDKHTHTYVTHTHTHIQDV